MRWECRARPNGKPCGHQNETGRRGVNMGGQGYLLCCEACGRTKKASDDRAKEEARERLKQGKPAP